MSRLDNSAGVDDDLIDVHVASHLADPALMRTNDFDAFFGARKRALLEAIATATGNLIEDSKNVEADTRDTLEMDDDTDDL